jgi:thiol-disulfide isomerase/thioredoxin
MCTLRPRHDRFLIPACVTFAAALGWLAGCPAAGADEPPRYKLAVGQELVYRTTDPPEESDDGAGGKTSRHSVTEWIVDVAGRGDDGTWWLVFREKFTHTYSQGGKDRTQELETDGHFRLSADGKFVENSTIRPMSNPTALFPALPPDAASATNGWEASLSLDETRRKFHVAPDAVSADGNTWRFVEEPLSALDAIYALSTVRDYAFDREAGLVRKAVTTYRQGWPAQSTDKPQVQTIELAEVRQLDTGDLAAIAQQAQVYFTAVEEYEKLAGRARRDFAHATMALIEAETRLKKATDEVTLPWLRAMVEARLKQHRRDAQYTIQDAVQFAKLLDQPSEEWQTTDLDGQPRGLSDYRGQVVVLDFWYRGCGWCIRAMPQMKQLADDYAGQAVAILGINSDQDLDDARFVIDKLRLNYPTLKNGTGDEQINTKYKIHGWPTLVVIDKKGVVRHLHFGYSPTLRGELGDKIRELLAEPAD